MAELTGSVRIWHTIIQSGARKTGLTPTLRIVRMADKYMYDWNDGTFKNSGWTTLNGNGTEHDATNNPGAYYWEIGSGSVVDVFTSAFVDGEYGFEVSEGTLPYQASAAYWIRKRRVVSLLAAQLVHNDKVLAEGSGNNYTVYEDDGSSELLVKDVKDKSGGAITLPSGTPAKETT
jgi:hypothetical protein